jgi:hypothetical protein
MTKNIPRIGSFIIIATAILFGMGVGSIAPRIAKAQTSSGPQFWMTWHAASSSVPVTYIGKALPSYGAKITAELALIDHGVPVDLSGQTIYWYLNNTLIGGGPGVDKITFSPFGLPPDTLSLEAELPSYNGQYLVHSIDIPYVAPLVVIGAPYPSGTFSSNPVAVAALPYFFASAPSDLSYVWSVNGQTGAGAENPQTAEITLPPNTAAGATMTIGLTVTDPSNNISASAQSTLTYAGQL